MGPTGKLAVLMCLVLNLFWLCSTTFAFESSDKSLLLSQGYIALGPIQPLEIRIELTLAKANCNSNGVYELTSSFMLNKQENAKIVFGYVLKIEMCLISGLSLFCMTGYYHRKIA